MKPEHFIMAELVAFAHAEAAHVGSAEAMLAVACIVRNRVKKGWAGGDWQAVMNMNEEVSAHEPAPRAPVVISTGPMRRMLQQVDDIYMGMFVDELTQGFATIDGKQARTPGLYFLDALYESRGLKLRPWFEQKILGDPVNHPRIAQVGMIYIFS